MLFRPFAAAVAFSYRRVGTFNVYNAADDLIIAANGALSP